MCKKSWILTYEKCKYCGKNIYKDEEDAQYALNSLDKNITYYKCPYGKGFHLTSKKDKNANL